MPSLIINIMWEGLLDYGRLEWQHVLQQLRNKQRKKIGSLNFLIRFQCPHHVICQQEIEMLLLAPLLGASFTYLFGFGCLGLVVFKSVTMNQQPLIHPLAVLSTRWAMFFHLTSHGVHHSPFLFATDHCTSFFLVCSWLFFPWT